MALTILFQCPKNIFSPSRRIINTRDNVKLYLAPLSIDSAGCSIMVWFQCVEIEPFSIVGNADQAIVFIRKIYVRLFDKR